MAKKTAKNKDTVSTERLFSLLMPSGDAQECIPYNAQPEPEPPPPAPAGAEKLDQLRKKLADVTQSPQPEPEDGIVLVSLTEAMVAERLDPALEKLGCCRCDRCKKRAAALALNELPPNYVAARMEQIEALLLVGPGKEVTAAINRAVMRVKATPDHERK